MTKSIAYDATTSGRVLLNGLVGAEVSFAFTLPDALTAGDKTLPIGAWTGCYGTTDVATACTTFTPSLSAATARLNAADGSLHLFIGATVSPSTVHLQGAYAARITVTAAYTGV